MELIFEDNHLLVVNKPAGLLTQPTEEVQESLEESAKAWLKKKYQKPGSVFLGVVHRLDRPVSGIVIFAKTSKALGRLNESIRTKETAKVYMALVEGVPPAKEGILEHYLKHDAHRAQEVSPQDPDGKLAKLSYKLVKQRDHFSLLEVRLETGRYHQIRCQCSLSGFPIAGDVKYGGHRHHLFEADEIALHHTQLVIRHPVTGDALTFDSTAPW